MSPRRRHLFGEPSQHDKDHPDSYGSYRRPLGALPPVVPQNTRPVRTFLKRAAWTLLISFLVLSAAAAAVYVGVLDKAEPTPPSNQPTEVAS